MWKDIIIPTAMLVVTLFVAFQTRRQWLPTPYLLAYLEPDLKSGILKLCISNTGKGEAPSARVFINEATAPFFSNVFMPPNTIYKSEVDRGDWEKYGTGYFDVRVEWYVKILWLKIQRNRTTRFSAENFGPAIQDKDQMAAMNDHLKNISEKLKNVLSQKDSIRYLSQPKLHGFRFLFDDGYCATVGGAHTTCVQVVFHSDLEYFQNYQSQFPDGGTVTVTNLYTGSSEKTKLKLVGFEGLGSNSGVLASFEKISDGE